MTPDKTTGEPSEGDTQVFCSGKWHPFSCDAVIDRLTSENKALREALERIATTHYRIYDGNKPYISDHDNSYSLGIADGHRLAAKWAEEALATKPTEGR